MGTIVEGIDDRTLLIAYLLYLLFLVLLVSDYVGFINPVTPWGKRLKRRRDREMEEGKKRVNEFIEAFYQSTIQAGVGGGRGLRINSDALGHFAR